MGFIWDRRTKTLLQYAMHGAAMAPPLYHGFQLVYSLQYSIFVYFISQKISSFRFHKIQLKKHIQTCLFSNDAIYV